MIQVLKDEETTDIDQRDWCKETRRRRRAAMNTRSRRPRQRSQSSL
jgi:hypothetical protein